LEPLDDLTDDCIKYLTSIGSSSKRVSQIVDAKEEIVHNTIFKGILVFIKLKF
jgi:hypothetical protein